VTRYRRFMIEYSHGWPGAFTVNALLMFYGLIAILDQFTGGLAAMPWQHFLLRIVGAGVVALSTLAIKRRAARRFVEPAA